jgi:hypothetical protein
MKNKFTLYCIILLICITSAKAQDVDCDELVGYIKSKGDYSRTVSTYGSSMLVSATLYTYDGDYYVIAKIKSGEYDFYGKEYIFCGVPYSNWLNFYSSGSMSYGKAFHNYIMDYKCDCN